MLPPSLAVKNYHNLWAGNTEPAKLTTYFECFRDAAISPITDATLVSNLPRLWCMVDKNNILIEYLVS